MGCVLLVLGDRVKRLVDLVDQGAGGYAEDDRVCHGLLSHRHHGPDCDMVTTISANMMKQVIVFITTDWVCCLLVMFLMEPIIAAVLGRVNPMRLFKKIAPGHHRSRLYLLQRRYPARFHEDCRQQAGRTGEDLRFYPSSGQHL